jgi:RNA polymerase sigma-70 factor, ECF subfamily
MVPTPARAADSLIGLTGKVFVTPSPPGKPSGARMLIRRYSPERNEAAVSVDESALLDALRRGDEDAFARLVADHHASLRRVARLYVNAAIADEVVQDTWLGVIRGVWAFEGRSSLKTWIFRILVNRARTRATRESRSAPFTGTLSTQSGAEPEHSPFGEDSPASGYWALPALDPSSSPERSLLTKELRERLQTVIEALPSNLRTVLWLRDVEGWSSEDVCNALAIHETNQRVLLHRARSRVRAALEPYVEGAQGRT